MVIKILSLLSGPLIGALIGYVTNYIAVKMLFHPYEPVYFMGRKLPFTPGVIPKRKADMASAVGKTIQKQLLREEEIRKILLKPGTKQMIMDGICHKADEWMHTDLALWQIVSGFTGPANYLVKLEHLEDDLTEEIVNRIKEADLGNIVAGRVIAYVNESVQSPLIRMFLTPDRIASATGVINQQIDLYLDDDGWNKIHEIVEEEANRLEDLKPIEVLPGYEEYMPVVRDRLDEVYEAFVEHKAGLISDCLPIQEIVEERIAGMDNRMIEELVLSVMKTELGMVIKLGALIGFILGLVNIFI